MTIEGENKELKAALAWALKACTLNEMAKDSMKLEDDMDFYEYIDMLESKFDLPDVK